MRVLHVIDSFQVGGAENSLLELVRAGKWEASVAALYASDTLREDFARAGATLFHLASPKAWGLVEATRWLLDVVRATRPDVLHTSLYRSGLVSRVVGLRTGTPVVDSFVNDSYGPPRLDASPMGQRARLHAIRIPDRALSFVPKLFISNSRAIAVSNSRALGVPMDRIRVVHRGRRAETFARSPELGAELRRELGLDGRIVVHVGRFVPQKGHETLVDAFAELPGDTRLLLVGDGPLLGQMKTRARARGTGNRIVFAGARRDLQRILSTADAFAFPSRFEGWPGAVVEAMLAGAPVVASDLEVHREIDGDRRCLTLFESGSASALAGKLRALLDNPSSAHEQAARAHERASEFTVEAMVEGHRAAYADVLESRR